MPFTVYNKFEPNFGHFRKASLSIKLCPKNLWHLESNGGSGEKNAKRCAFRKYSGLFLKLKFYKKIPMELADDVNRENLANRDLESS